jgi:ribose 5-phosphate isomerase A
MFHQQAYLKERVAKAALDYLDGHTVIGVGSGSTVHYFIHALASLRGRIEGCVASSVATASHLKEQGLPVIELSMAEPLTIYVDGADEVTSDGYMIKGGGGALTREKIVATVADEFLCLVDESKWVSKLGQFPIAVEVLPMARSLVGRELVKLGGDPVYREGFITDNGNIILDVFHLNLTELLMMEDAINKIPGVVENGLFARRRADRILVAGRDGVTVHD